MIEIAKALMRDTRVLVMDEPTSSLTNVEIERLFTQIRRRVSCAESVRVLFGRERDIALAGYDGKAAAEAILAMAESCLTNRRRRQPL